MNIGILFFEQKKMNWKTEWFHLKAFDLNGIRMEWFHISTETTKTKQLIFSLSLSQYAIGIIPN